MVALFPRQCSSFLRVFDSLRCTLPNPAVHNADEGRIRALT